MKGVNVTYKSGTTKFYDGTGYKLQNHKFKNGMETALIIFKGEGKRPVALRFSNIKTWKVEK